MHVSASGRRHVVYSLLIYITERSLCLYCRMNLDLQALFVITSSEMWREVLISLMCEGGGWSLSYPVFHNTVKVWVCIVKWGWRLLQPLCCVQLGDQELATARNE
jgi:hypothetical protein